MTMAGIIHVDGTTVEATSGQMLVTFESGGEAFRFILPKDVGVGFRTKLLVDAWQVLCFPDAEVVSLAARRARARRESRAWKQT